MDRGETPFLGGLKMKEIKEMKEEDLIKMLKVIRKEIDRRRFEAWEKYTGVKYPLKKTLKKEVYDEKGRA
jgi:hypothetical protein